MQITIQRESQQIAATDRLELNQRARHWLKRVLQMIRSICVRVTDASSSAGAHDRACVIEAHLENGRRLEAHARGRLAIVAIDRALRRLARAIKSLIKREAASREVRALITA
jgi:hypothetical protein